MTPSRTSAIEAARAKRLSYDELRERRLMQATWARFEHGASQPVHTSWITPRRVTLACGAIGLAVSIGAVVRWQVAENPRAAVALAPPERRVAFSDGSEATLFGSAGIRAVLDRSNRVEVVQRAGKVIYKVRPNHEREFVVRAGDVSVTVLGTQFSVDLGDSMAEVRVIEGRVRIDDKQRTTELVAGEALNAQAWHAQGAEKAPQAPPPEIDTGEKSALRGEPRAADKPATPSAQELLAQADEARAAQNWNEAVRLLRTLLARYPSAPNKSNVLFMLARAERNRGSHAEAASVFGKCAALGGTLASEALAEEAASWLKAGQRERAVDAAKRYVKRYPNGPQAQKMQDLAD